VRREVAEKALVVERGESPPRTHRLTDLLTLLGVPALDELADELRSLEGFYMPTRYPDALPDTLPEALPGEQEAQEALTAARRGSNAVRGILCS
jgi:HEPN domain-containing protein